MMIQISGKRDHLAQKSKLYRKNISRQSSNLSTVKFRQKANMQNNAYTKPVNLEV